jgi:hypothetical protein
MTEMSDSLWEIGPNDLGGERASTGGNPQLVAYTVP